MVSSGTLFNHSTVTVTKRTDEFEIDDETALGKVGPFTGTFGQQANGAKLAGPTELMVKEIRVWTEKRKDSTTKDTRNQQIDPVFIKNKNLFYYLKLAKEQKNHKNFARFNHWNNDKWISKNFPEEALRSDISEALLVGKYKFIEDVKL